MKTYLECIPCFFGQALRAGRASTDDEAKIKRLLDELGAKLSDISLDSTPPETGRLLHRMVREITGNPDPFREIKHRCTEQALTLYPSMKQTIQQSGDRLLAAIRMAVAGNIIDFGASANFDVEQTIEETLTKEFAIFDYRAFKAALDRTDRILYIGDNAGETVFDRLLIEEMGKPVTYAVRGVPVINDAVIEDAVQAGLDKVATVVSSGTDAPGTILKTCSPEFRRLVAESDLIIAKGQGNFEALSGEDLPIFFILKIKCRIIAKDLGLERGDIILKACRG